MVCGSNTKKKTMQKKLKKSQNVKNIKKKKRKRKKEEGGEVERGEFGFGEVVTLLPSSLPKPQTSFGFGRRRG